MNERANADQARRLLSLATRLLGQVSGMVGGISADALTKLGGHRYGYAVLATLQEFGILSQAELSRRTNLDRSDMTATVKGLELDGYVQRSPDPLNRRQNLVSITPSGKAQLALLDAALDIAQQDALAPLSASERVQLLDLLRKLYFYHSAIRQPNAVDAV